MKKNYLLAVILIIALVSSLGMSSFMDADAAQLQIDTPTLKPTVKATDTPLPKPTSTPTVKPTLKASDTPLPKPTNTPTP
jgi:hypothetical protein